MNKSVSKMKSLLNVVSPSLMRQVQHDIEQHRYDKIWRNRNDVVPVMPFLDIETTLLCNLRCPFCWWWGESGLVPKMLEKKDPAVINPLTTEKIKKLMWDAKKLGTKTIHLSGAEPFMRKDTVELIEYGAQLGIDITINTNGTLLDDAILRRLAKVKNLSMVFSIDGPKDVHDSIRGKGVFDKVTTVIKKLAEYKGNNTSLRIETNTTFSPLIRGRVMELARFLDTLPIDNMTFQQLWFTTKEVAEVHKRFMKENFNIEDNGVDGHIISMPQRIYIEELIKEVDELSSARFSKPLNFKPLIRSKQINLWYTDLHFVVRQTCTAPWGTFVRVKTSGEVVFCPDDWVNYSIGNVHNESILELWNNDKAKKFRHVLGKVGTFPACARCCILG